MPTQPSTRTIVLGKLTFGTTGELPVSKRVIPAMRNRLSNQPGATPPADPHAALAAITKAVGLPDNASEDQIIAAVQALFGATADPVPDSASEAQAARYNCLSASELAAVKATPGATVASFVAAKRYLQGGAR
jgi:alpha-beta hydrolase superfamily lysophospholipase